MDMIRNVTQPSSSCQGIQCGTPRISIVAKTGSPMVPLLQQGFGGAHGLVVAHVLVHGQRDARLLASFAPLRAPRRNSSPAAFARGCL